MIRMFNEISGHKDNNLFQGHPNDVGFDIRSGETGMIPPRCSSGFIYTGLHLCLPPWLCGSIKARSGQLKIDITADGTIDPDYQGAIGIKLFNHHLCEPYRYKVGDRIAQLQFEIAPEAFFNRLAIVKGKYSVSFGKFAIVESENMDDWPITSRGARGFGSTGVQ